MDGIKRTSILLSLDNTLIMCRYMEYRYGGFSSKECVESRFFLIYNGLYLKFTQVSQNILILFLHVMLRSSMKKTTKIIDVGPVNWDSMDFI